VRTASGRRRRGRCTAAATSAAASAAAASAAAATAASAICRRQRLADVVQALGVLPIVYLRAAADAVPAV
jgi:hypothetical protein